MTVAPQELTVLGASGATGLELVRQAIGRGHAVLAVARHAEGITVPDHPLLQRVAADILDADGMAEVLQGRGVVLSGLGVRGAGPANVLSAGARAVVAAQPDRIVWLGAFGTGRSARAAGWLTQGVLTLALRGQIQDKVVADDLVLSAGGTVVHAGPLSTGPLSPFRRTVRLEDVPRRIFPASVSRATVAASMLDVAEGSGSGLIVPLER